MAADSLTSRADRILILRLWFVCEEPSTHRSRPLRLLINALDETRALPFPIHADVIGYFDRSLLKKLRLLSPALAADSVSPAIRDCATLRIATRTGLFESSAAIGRP